VNLFLAQQLTRRGELRYPIMKRTSVLVRAVAALAISAIGSSARAQTPSWTYTFPQPLFGAGWFSPLRNDNYAGALDVQSESNRPTFPNQSGGMCRRRGPMRSVESQRNGFYGF
jgi:hypothetical protein